MKDVYCNITTAVPNAETAKKITAVLLEKCLAAGIQQMTVQSTYRWEGAVKTKEEFVLTIKTRKSLYKKVRKVILALHPYQVAEIACMPIVKGSSEFLDWIKQETRRGRQ